MERYGPRRGCTETESAMRQTKFGQYYLKMEADRVFSKLRAQVKQNKKCMANLHEIIDELEAKEIALRAEVERVECERDVTVKQLERFIAYPILDHLLRNEYEKAFRQAALTAGGGGG